MDTTKKERTTKLVKAEKRRTNMKITFRSEIYDRGRATEYIIHVDEDILGAAYELRKLVPREYDYDVQDRIIDEMFYETKRRVKKLLEQSRKEKV